MSTRAESLADLRPAYVVVSEHQALLDEVVDRIKARVAEDGDINLSLDEFDADDTSPGEVLSAASVLPFLAAKRVVVVKNAQRWNDKDLETLVGYLATPAPDTCLVVVHRDREPRRANEWRLPSLAKRSTTLYEAARKQGFLLERQGPRWPSEYPKWVVARGREQGLTLDPPAAAYLVEATGHDLVGLIQDLDKLALVYKEGARLDREAVEAMVAPYDRGGLFDYLDSVFAGRPRDAVADLAALTLGRDPTAVLAALTERLREAIRVKSLKAKGAKEPEILRELGLGKKEGWKLKRPVQAAARFEMHTLVGLLTHAVDIEARVKSGGLDGRLGLELLTVQVARAAGGRTIGTTAG